MKILIFKVNNQKVKNIIGLIKEIDKISCQIHIDIKNGFVVAKNVEESFIDTIIELINNYYTILNLYIDNIN